MKVNGRDPLKPYSVEIVQGNYVITTTIDAYNTENLLEIIAERYKDELTENKETQIIFKEKVIS
ncbi:hypothetical protein ACIP9C_22645 [Lysinibacillus sp. NPDC093210]|uniref:hypothetical protein n=1 Tax=Lysinibacillus sp. NPDC093210 TaxID=3364133 RepID=UPI0038135DE7